METGIIGSYEHRHGNTPILPMRHGNTGKFRLFLSNLSGTPILPMRHGNRKYLFTEAGAMYTPILPMRHGNGADAESP